MNIINLGRIFKLSRFFKKKYFIHWNRFKFKICGIKLGRNSRIFNKVYIDKEIGAQVIIGDNFTLSSGANFNPLCRNIRACICVERADSVIEIGHNVGLSSPCLWARKKIKIGNYVNIGGNCIIMDSDAHNLDWRIRCSGEMYNNKETLDSNSAKCAAIEIGDYVFIGSQCIILKGVTIGSRSVIAAGSVVTKNIPAGCVAGGNPCRVIRYTIE